MAAPPFIFLYPNSMVGQMYQRILKQIQEKVQARQYLMTFHAEEEMLKDGLRLDEVERTILTGNIVERQKDRVTKGWKYRIQGKAKPGQQVEVIVKLHPLGKAVIITIYKMGG